MLQYLTQSGHGPQAFANNQLSNIKIPNSVTSIGLGAFQENQFLSFILDIITIGFVLCTVSRFTS